MPIKTIIDTNVLVSSLSSRSSYHWLIKIILNGNIDLHLNDEILLEYEEILSVKYSPGVALKFIVALKELPNVYFTQIYYHWNLMKDQDDNKFVDCYIASGSQFIITHDKGFNTLIGLQFPKVNVVKIDDFKKIYDDWANSNFS